MAFSAESSWNPVVGEMLPLSECDVCGPPLDIVPPPPLPTNFKDYASLSGSCNVCSLLRDVEITPTQTSDASLLPIVATLVVGILVITVTLIVLFVKIKKCRAFLPYMFCWIFPRSMLPHTELAPSSLPSPSPSTEKLKGGKRRWHGSNHSLQSENIYEVCSPPSQDSLYEEVGPSMKAQCSPYGVVLVEKSPCLVGDAAANSIPKSWLNAGPSYPGILGSAMRGEEAKPISHFSTFGGSGRGFVNPTIRDGTSSALSMPAHQTLQSYRSLKNAVEIPEPKGKVVRSLGNEHFVPPVQKRQLPPVPLETINFSI